jgi:AcrR family transcriptional regulator
MRQEERRARTFAALVDAAEAAFARAGYDGAAIEAVASAAGLSKGAVYTHFQTKLDLFLIVVDATLEDADRRTRRVAEALADGVDMTGAAGTYMGEASDPIHVALVAEIWRMSVMEPRVREKLEAFRRERLAILSQAAVAAGQRPGAALGRAETVARLIDAETLEKRLRYAAGA